MELSGVEARRLGFAQYLAADRRDVAKALEAKFGDSKKAALIWRPQNMIAVDDEAGEKILKLIGSLEDNDDVQNVYVNAEFSDALVAKMSG